MAALATGAVVESRPGTALGDHLASWTIGIVAFLGAFVLREPAPYEIILAVVMVCFLVLGMRFSRHAIVLATLFVIFNVGGLLSMLTMSDYKEIPLYLAVSLFLGFSSVFWCAVVETDPNRLRVLMRGYVIGATITAILGIVGYFGVLPGAQIFTLYDRAAGAFQDPNVFGPFLILPIIYLIYGILYRGGWLSLPRLILLAIMLAGLFLSFSRGAWGAGVLSGLIFCFLLLVTEPDKRIRARLILIGVFGAAAMVILLVVALQFDAVSAMFEQRARVVQEYDSAQFGRFARHAIGFQWALENPLGIGPLEFGAEFKQDTHNIWLKSLMAYGWIGFFSYLTVTVITLFGGFKLLGRTRPWQPYLICAWSVYAGHIVLAWVIDIDHWRHAYLIIGMIWGCMALEVRHQRRRQPA